jgi:hypothetical protein
MFKSESLARCDDGRSRGANLGAVGGVVVANRGAQTAGGAEELDAEDVMPPRGAAAAAARLPAAATKKGLRSARGGLRSARGGLPPTPLRGHAADTATRKP